MIRVFISYARADLEHLETLRTFAARLTADGSVEVFDDRNIEPGDPWNETLIGQLNRADVVVLLLTANFVASRFCMETELPVAIRRQEQGLCVIIPLYVAPYVLSETDELGRLQRFPSTRPITGPGGRADEAWAAAAREILRKVDARRGSRAPTVAGDGGRPVRVAARDLLADAVQGGAGRRTAAAVRSLDRAMAGAVDERAARLYGRCVKLAVRVDPETARDRVARYDSRIPDAAYPAAFGPDDRDWLATLAASGDRYCVEVAFELAVRLRFVEVQKTARDRLLPVLATDPHPAVLVRWLDRCEDLGLLTRPALHDALATYVAHTPLGRNRPLWTDFLTALPEELLPGIFEVHLLLGRCVTAAPLADSPKRVESVLRLALASDFPEDVEAALRLPRSPAHDALRRALDERAGDLHAARSRYAEAAEHYHAAGRADRVSECHERLGRFADALESCPADRPDRIAGLVGHCLPELRTLAGREDWTPAAARIGVLMAHLDRATDQTGEVSAGRDTLRRMREVLLVQARQRFGDRVRDADDIAAVAQYREWSRFEETAGEYARAAELAEAAGDLVPAYDLYFRARQFGDADRVLNTDPSADATVRRAKAREAGGDLVGAARHYRAAGDRERAADLFERVRRFDEAARCLLEHHRSDALDARLVRVLRGAGDVAELVRRCVAATGEPLAVEELRRLAADPALAATLRSTVTEALDALDGRARRAFEARAQAWVAQARREVDERYAGVWGLDLGTSTCVVAIYDTVRREPVLCRWEGNPGHFASTVSVDRQGHELVGLTLDELSANGIVAYVDRSKRYMGTGRQWRVGNGATYRPEEVAARLVRYARQRVEALLAGQVRDRVGELARAELGRVDEAWLTWAGHHHDLRLDRPRAVVTIPAYFPLTAKNATRDACRIAGVELIRLIHEPTAACLAATGAEGRALRGSVVVVDLGAGTLDISLLEIDDDVYTVKEVFGDNHYGAGDFDDLIVRELTRRLERQNIAVRETGGDRRRLTVVAEKLKIDLSRGPEAERELADFHDRTVRFVLTQDELARILDDSLATLRDVCTTVQKSVPDDFRHLVLVGGPMFAPIVRRTVERALGRRSARIRNPRSAVALGAALQGAVIDGTIKRVLLDVTPFALGIQAVTDGKTVFSELVPRNTTIPAKKSKIFTTEVDNQRNVAVQVYNGQLDPELRIGRFVLPDLPPAPRGVPQIEITFDIDVSCVLTVTARDLATGNVRSIQITDTTLLTPAEVTRMTARHEAVVRANELRAELTGRVAEARRQIAEAERTAEEFARRRSAHRPGAEPLDEAAHRALVEMYRAPAGLDLVATTQVLQDVTTWADGFLAGPGGASETTVAEAQRLADELATHLNRLATELTRVGDWTGLLKDLAARDPDPVHRFRTHHDAGEYQQALDVLARLPEPLRERADLDRHLRCLAEVGDFDRYREVALGNADRLGLVVLDAGDPDGFLRSVADALRVECSAGERIATVVDAGHGTATLTVAGSAAPASLPVGHPGAVRIGARVWALVRTGAGGAWELRPGLVDRLDTGPAGERLFRTGITVPAAALGGPLLDDLGLVIGVLTATDESGSVAEAAPTGRAEAAPTG